jgi:hypothetical protein
MFIFSIYYYSFALTKSQGLVAFLAYFCVMFTASATIFIMTGTFGVIASYYFNKKIFSIVKAD